mgnify:CR=1 FL=1
MEHSLKTILVPVLFLISGLALGQSPALDYTVLSKGATCSGRAIEVSSTITRTGGALTWEQTGTGFSETTAFTISATTGSWDRDTSTGSLTHALTDGTRQYELVLEGTGNTLTLTLVPLSGTAQGQAYVFDVNAIIYQ